MISKGGSHPRPKMKRLMRRTTGSVSARSANRRSERLNAMPDPLEIILSAVPRAPFDERVRELVPVLTDNLKQLRVSVTPPTCQRRSKIDPLWPVEF
jgi:hypothetical protein